MPKGKMIANFYQSMFQHYPKHQDCAIDVLHKMEKNGEILYDVFRLKVFFFFFTLDEENLVNCFERGISLSFHKKIKGHWVL